MTESKKTRPGSSRSAAAAMKTIEVRYDWFLPGFSTMKSCASAAHTVSSNAKSQCASRVSCAREISPTRPAATTTIQ